jgi:plastocyanin
MAINFPSNPSLNDTFTSGGVVFIWNGTSWSSSTVSEISNDATPRLGGDLDVDGNTIEGTGDINLTGIVTATSANFSGNVSIGGTLTYEDVTNIDSVGLITARSGIDATGTVTATTFSGSGSSLTSLNASQLSSGTIPDARFPATLPAVSGANLTNLDASDLSSGTIPDARFPSVLPAVSAANLTNLPDNVATWTLGADGISNYTFSGPGLTGAESDPTIYLQRGVTYKFVNTMNAHPFRIQSTENGSTGTQYNDGITNNDVSNGTLEWDVQFDAPNELYYQCTSHSNMGGKIIIGGGGGEGFSQLDTWLYG